MTFIFISFIFDYSVNNFIALKHLWKGVLLFLRILVYIFTVEWLYTQVHDKYAKLFTSIVYLIEWHVHLYYLQCEYHTNSFSLLVCGTTKSQLEYMTNNNIMRLLFTKIYTLLDKFFIYFLHSIMGLSCI